MHPEALIQIGKLERSELEAVAASRAATRGRRQPSRRRHLWFRTMLAWPREPSVLDIGS